MKETLEYTIKNPVGLYVDIVNQLTSVAGRFNAVMTLSYHDKTVNLKSVMGVLSLGIPTKAVITITAEGPDAHEAIQAVQTCFVSLNV